MGFAQGLEFAAIIDTGSLRGEDEVGPAADDLRIIASEIESEEGSSAGSDPRAFDVVVLEMGEIVLDGAARPERSSRACFVFFGEWVLLPAERRVGPSEAEEERVERLSLGLVVAHDRDDAGRVSARKLQSARVRLPPRKWPAAFERPAAAVNVIRPVKMRMGERGAYLLFQQMRTRS